MAFSHIPLRSVQLFIPLAMTLNWHTTLNTKLDHSNIVAVLKAMVVSTLFKSVSDFVFSYQLVAFKQAETRADNRFIIKLCFNLSEEESYYKVDQISKNL